MTTFYQRLIHEIAPDVNPAAVEAFMRLEHSTLNGLPRARFVSECELVRLISASHMHDLRELAASYGMGEDYDHWEQRIADTEAPSQAANMHGADAAGGAA